MVREIGIHDDDKGACRECQAVDVCGAEAHLSGSGFEDDVRGAVEGLELFGDLEGPVWRAVVDDDDFPLEVAARTIVSIGSNVVERLDCSMLGLKGLE